MPHRDALPWTGQLARLVGERLLWLLLLVYGLATLWPSPGLLLRTSTVYRIPLPLILLAILLFNAGLAVDSGQLKAALRRSRLLLGGLLLLWGVPGVVVWIVGQLPWELPRGMVTGAAMVALMPSAASSVAWTQLSRGNLALSLGLLLSSTLLCPLLIGWLGSGTSLLGQDALSATTSSVFGLFLWIIPAVLAGIVVRRAVGSRRITAIRPQLKLTSAVLLLVLNYANASVALPEIFFQPDPAAMAMVLLVAVSISGTAFSAGWFCTALLPLEESARPAFFYSVSMKNTGMGLVLAGLAVEPPPFTILIIILYTLIQHLLAAGYHRRVMARLDGSDRPVVSRSA